MMVRHGVPEIEISPTPSASTNRNGSASVKTSVRTPTEDEELLQMANNLNPPKFTIDQRETVRDSWKAIDAHISQIGLSMYLELFKRSPETLSLFPFLKHLSQEDLEFYAQLRNHAVRVTGVLSMLIKLLDKPIDEADKSMSEFLLDLGRRHFGYGSSPHLMELMGHVFVESLCPVFANDPRQAQIQEAWLSFFRVIVFWLATGFKFVQSKEK